MLISFLGVFIRIIISSFPLCVCVCVYKESCMGDYISCDIAPSSKILGKETAEADSLEKE